MKSLFKSAIAVPYFIIIVVAILATTVFWNPTTLIKFEAELPVGGLFVGADGFQANINDVGTFESKTYVRLLSGYPGQRTYDTVYVEERPVRTFDRYTIFLFQKPDDKGMMHWWMLIYSH